MTVRWVTIPTPTPFQAPEQDPSRSPAPKCPRFQTSWKRIIPVPNQETARGGLGAPARPRFPPPAAGGGARPSRSRSAPPPREGDRGEMFSGEVKGSPSGHRASKPRHQTPTSGRNQRNRTLVSPPFRQGGGRREKRARARGSRREEARPLLPQGPPPAAQACVAQIVQSRTTFRAQGVLGGSTARPRSPSSTPLSAPSMRVRGRSLRWGRGFPGKDACAAPVRSGSDAAPTCAAPAPAPERCAPTLGGSSGSSAAEPRLMLRREVAASPAAGGGCTRTQRGGGGARRPGPCSRGPARGGHLEARRRSPGTSGGGSGGDRSSST